MAIARAAIQGLSWRRVNKIVVKFFALAGIVKLSG
jgi:hypothetical protein